MECTKMTHRKFYSRSWSSSIQFDWHGKESIFLAIILWRHIPYRDPNSDANCQVRTCMRIHRQRKELRCFHIFKKQVLTLKNSNILTFRKVVAGVMSMVHKNLGEMPTTDGALIDIKLSTIISNICHASLNKQLQQY